MLIEALRGEYGYNRWATEQILNAATQLSPEQWLAPGSAGRGSMRDTLVHLISAQRGWLAWWDGSLAANEAMRSSLDPAGLPDVAAVRTVLATVNEATLKFIDGLSESDLQRVYANDLPSGQHFRLPLWQMMLHVANHGTQHRSEAAAMLTAYDHSPGQLDLLQFFRSFGDVRKG